MRDFKSLKIWQRAHALAIAEGCGAATKPEFARFLDMSIKSLNETEGHLLTARELDLFSIEEWQNFTSETVEIQKMTYTYRKKILQSAEG